MVLDFFFHIDITSMNEEVDEFGESVVFLRKLDVGLLKYGQNLN